MVQMNFIKMVDRFVLGVHDTLTPYAPYPQSLAGQVPANLIDGPSLGLTSIIGQPVEQGGTQVTPVVSNFQPQNTNLTLPEQRRIELWNQKVATEKLQKDLGSIPQWAKDLGILDIKFAELRDNPEKAKEFFAVLYKHCRQFVPLKDFIKKIMENPHIQVPASYKEHSPDYALVTNDAGQLESFAYRYEDTNVRKPKEPSEEAKRWLNNATFLDVYNEVFGTDLKDAIVHHESYEAYRYTSAVLGLVEWGLPLVLGGAAAWQLWSAGSVETPAIDELILRPDLAVMVGLASVTTLVSPTGGAQRSPVAQIFLGAATLAQRIVNGKWLDLATTVSEFFRRDPVNEFAAKHLSTFGVVKKYGKMIVTRGQTGIIFELYKDVADQYKWYKVISKGYKFVKGSVVKTGKDQISNLYSVAPGITHYLPGSNRLIEAAMMFAWTLPVTALAVATSGDTSPASIASTLGAATLLIGASTGVKTYFDRIKKENLMEALTYDMVVGEGTMIFSYVSNHFEVFKNPLVFGAGLAGYALATIGAGWLIHATHAKAPDEAATKTA